MTDQNVVAWMISGGDRPSWSRRSWWRALLAWRPVGRTAAAACC